MTKSSTNEFIAALARPAIFFNELSKILRRRRALASARRQLLAMDERQLRDIGLSRADAYGDFMEVGRRRYLLSPNELTTDGTPTQKPVRPSTKLKT